MSLVLHFPAIAIAIMIFFSSGYMAFLHAYAQQFPGDIDHAPIGK